MAQQGELTRFGDITKDIWDEMTAGATRTELRVARSGGHWYFVIQFDNDKHIEVGPLDTETEAMGFYLQLCERVGIEPIHNMAAASEIPS